MKTTNSADFSSESETKPQIYSEHLIQIATEVHQPSDEEIRQEARRTLDAFLQQDEGRIVVVLQEILESEKKRHSRDSLEAI
jgi:hypothetical protein